MEPVAGEIAEDASLVLFGVVVAIEVEDPEGIEMGMNGHVESVGGEADGIIPASHIFSFIVAVLACGGGENEKKGKEKTKF